MIGVDPCSESASPDYFLNFELLFALWKMDLQEGLFRSQTWTRKSQYPLTIHCRLLFSMNLKSAVGIIVLGRNVTESLEVFGENFEIQTALVVGGEALTVGDYYEGRRGLGILLIIRDSLLYANATDSYEYSYINESLGARISSIPLSKKHPCERT